MASDTFNLDQAIAEWRRQMLAAGVKAPVPLDELESHLREDIEQQMRSGLSPQQSFETAVRRIGEAHALETEFAKMNKESLRMGFASVLVVGLILLSGFTFIRMELNADEQVLAYAAVACTLGVAFCWRYAVPFLPVISNKAIRLGAGSVCIGSGFLCASFFSNVILPRFEHAEDHQIPAVGFWLVLPIAVFLCLGLALMMSARDRERWGMQNALGRAKRTIA